MTLITTSADFAWRPDKTASINLDAVLPDSFLVDMTVKVGECIGDADFMRVPFVTDGNAAVVAEGAAITPSEPGLDEVAFQTVAVKDLSKVSNELMRGAGNGARILASLQRSVQSKVNAEFVERLDVLGAGFLDGGTIAGAADLDVFSDALADVEANGGSLSHWLMPASAWKALAALKTGSGSNLPILGVGAVATDKVERSIFGVPVRLHSGAANVYGITRDDLPSAYSPLRVAVSEHAYFDADSTGVRADLRFGYGAGHLNQHVRIALV